MSARFHHPKLPDHSGLLVGRMPAEPFGFRCDDLQIWFNNTSEPWTDDRPHAHDETEEVFIVLGGKSLCMLRASHTWWGHGNSCAFPGASSIKS